MTVTHTDTPTHPPTHTHALSQKEEAEGYKKGGKPQFVAHEGIIVTKFSYLDADKQGRKDLLQILARHLRRHVVDVHHKSPAPLLPHCHGTRFGCDGLTQDAML